MLMALGPVLFDISLDLQSVEEVWNSAYARHDVMGAAPIYENVGEEESTITLTGELYPYHFGGLGGMAALEAARTAKIPLPLLRADGMPFGFVLISSISRTDNMLDAGQGIGNQIEYSVKLIKVGSPGLGGAEALLRLFL